MLRTREKSKTQHIYFVLTLITQEFMKKQSPFIIYCDYQATNTVKWLINVKKGHLYVEKAENLY